MKNTDFRTSGIERWGFALFVAGEGIINTFVGGFLQINLTNIGVTAYTVGILLLAVRVWDAISNPIFGAILDKSHLKSGKFLPWLRTANMILPFALIFMFAIPASVPVFWKVLWAAFSYVFYEAAYTMCDVPIFAMTSVMTDQVHERINIMSRSTVVSTLTIVMISVLAPQIYSAVGGFYTSIMIAGIAAVSMFFMSRFAKERFVNKNTEKVTIGSMLSYIKDNKYLRIGFLGIMVLSFTSMTNTVLVYFAVNCLGSMGMVSVISILIAVPMLVIGSVLPILTRKFDKFTLLMTGIIGQTVMCFVCYFVGYHNLPLFLVSNGIRFVFFALQLVLQLMFTGDFVEYGEYVTGKRLQGTAFSVQTFVFQFMNAIPAGIAMLILGAFGFIGGENAVQPHSAISAIWVLYILSPVVGALASLPIFAKYKLRDKTVQIMAAANSGIITREEAEIKLAARGI